MVQYMPRMNSSTSYTSIPPGEFSQDCATRPGAYSVVYHFDSTTTNSIDVRVCMPANFSSTPWKRTRNRQDISESMFLDIETRLQNTNIKYVVNSTLGYFELPNYGNDGFAGPLLANDPFDFCHTSASDKQCMSLGLHRRSLQIDEGVANDAVGRSGNRGPLTMVAAALFRPGSFIETQISQNGTQPPASSEASVDGPCNLAPLAQLMRGISPLCGNPYSDSYTLATVEAWLNFFKIDSTNDIQNALHAAVIIAGQTLLSDTPFGSLDVGDDMGTDSIRPKVSTTGVIVVTVLLAADLFLMLSLAIYVNFSHTWTLSFDAETMMRLGAV